jgi:hypothetical protein
MIGKYISVADRQRGVVAKGWMTPDGWLRRYANQANQPMAKPSLTLQALLRGMTSVSMGAQKPQNHMFGSVFRQEYGSLFGGGRLGVVTYVTARLREDAEKFAASRGWEEGDWDYIGDVGDLKGHGVGHFPMWDLWGYVGARTRYWHDDPMYPHFWWKRAGGKFKYPEPAPWEAEAARIEREWGEW